MALLGQNEGLSSQALFSSSEWLGVKSLVIEEYSSKASKIILPPVYSHSFQQFTAAFWDRCIVFVFNSSSEFFFHAFVQLVFEAMQIFSIHSISQQGFHILMKYDVKNILYKLSSILYAQIYKNLFRCSEICFWSRHGENPLLWCSIKLLFLFLTCLIDLVNTNIPFNTFDFKKEKTSYLVIPVIGDRPSTVPRSSFIAQGKITWNPCTY